MKVLHIETGRHLYGGALQVRYLLEGLSARGIENILACPRDSEIAAAARPFAVVEEVAMGGEADPRLFFYLSRILGRNRPNIVHVHSRRGADLWGPLAARLHGVKAILTRRVDNPEPGWLARLKYWPYERIVTISEGIRQVLLGEGIPEEKMVCVHSAVDLEDYRLTCNRNWFQTEFDLGPEEKAIGVVAQLIERKGHRYLIEAAPEVLEKCPQARFVFFGKGPLREELENLCREKGIADKVRFAGFRDDLPRILPCLDLVVHPATMEGLGVSLLQAAAVGVPIVASGVGGIPEIVRNGKNGFLVRPREAQLLVEPILELLQDSDKARRMGKAGRQIVESEFSIPTMVAENMKVYSFLHPL
jgi:glycosyltransferase involved in cell wall biosynthesis